MSTADATPSYCTPARAAAPPSSAASFCDAGLRAPDANLRVFGGLRWVYRPPTDALLAAVPADAWADPQRQGWARVKENPRREVWRAYVEGRPLYLKYYLSEPRLRRISYWFRAPACCAEWAGGLYAERAGIAAARPLAYTRGLRREGQTCWLLITEAIEPAESLSDFWLRLQSDEDVARRRQDEAQLADCLGELIARAHQAGFEHLDMHAANILVQTTAPRRYRPAFIDLQSARLDLPLSARAVVRNLAQLNQWFRKNSAVGQRLRFLRAYLRWRNEFETVFAHGRPIELSFDQLVDALERAARRHAERLGAQRDRRTARDGRYFTRLRLSGGWRGMAVTSCKHPTDESRASGLAFDRKWWQAQLARPGRWFADAPEVAGAGVGCAGVAVAAHDTVTAPGPIAENGAAAESRLPAYCKNSHSALVRRAVLPHTGGNVLAIIKRPRARNWRRRIALALPPSRSARAWRLGHAMLHRDVPTARPLAILEQRLGPLVLDNLLVTEAIAGATDLESLLHKEGASLAPAAWAQLKHELTVRLAAHLRRLHDAGFEHRDCKASNVLVVRYPRLALLWIDLDGVRPARIRWETGLRGVLRSLPVALRHCGKSLLRAREALGLRPWNPGAAWSATRDARQNAHAAKWQAGSSGVLPAHQLRALTRLHVSLLDVPGLTQTDRVRFLKHYLMRYGAAPDGWRELWPVLADLSAAKRRAKLARREWKLKHYGRA